MKPGTLIKQLRARVRELENEVEFLRLCLLDLGNLQSRCAVARMARLLDLIRSENFPNATHLAAALKTSTKTIYRDLEFLKNNLRLPIRFDGQRNGYALDSAPVALLGRNGRAEQLPRFDLSAIIKNHNQKG